MRYTLIKRSKYMAQVVKEADSISQIMKYKVASEMMEDNQDDVLPLLHTFEILINIDQVSDYMFSAEEDKKKESLADHVRDEQKEGN